MSNKVRYGLKKAYYSKVTMNGTTPTFGTPTALPGAVSMTLEPQGEESSFRADDGDYFVTESNNGYDGNLELAIIPDDFYVDCLGQQMDNDDLLVETEGDEGSFFALLFEFTGDESAIRHCMYYCKATRPNQDADTMGETKEVKTETIPFKARPIPGTKRVKVRTTEDTDTTRYNSWYTTVALPDFPELTVSPVNAAFNGTDDVVLTVTGGTVDAVKLNGSAVNSSNYTVSNGTVTLKSTYLAGLTAGVKKFKLFSGTDNAVVKVTIPASS